VLLLLPWFLKKLSKEERIIHGKWEKYARTIIQSKIQSLDSLRDRHIEVTESRCVEYSKGMQSSEFLTFKIRR